MPFKFKYNNILKTNLLRKTEMSMNRANMIKNFRFMSIFRKPKGLKQMVKNSSISIGNRRSYFNGRSYYDPNESIIYTMIVSKLNYFFCNQFDSSSSCSEERNSL